MKHTLHLIDELFADNGQHPEYVPVMTALDADVDLTEVVEVPDELPILPIRGNVLFPTVLLPITAGRDKSIKLLKQAAKKHEIIGVFTQCNDEEEPFVDDLHDVGTAARVVKVLELPDGSYFALMHGMCRIKLTYLQDNHPFLMGKVTDISSLEVNDIPSSSLRSRMSQLRKRYIEVLKAGEMPNVGSQALKDIKDPRMLINFISTHNTAESELKYQLLPVHSLMERYDMLMALLNGILDSYRLQAEISSRAHEAMDRQQREHFLNHQLQVIQQELGGNQDDKEIEEMVTRSQSKQWTNEALSAFNKSINRLRRTPQQSPEYSMEMNYAHLLLDLPWCHCTVDNLDTNHARKILDHDHFGLEKVKERILEHIAVLKLRGNLASPIICLVGPPGTGKTSLGRSIAMALGRKYARVALGGLHDEAEIRGHRRTYIGAMPGRIIQSLNKVQTSNPVFVLDEIDKIQTNAFQGDPTSALLEVLDPEQNSTFHDNYLDLDYDLSKVLFIATANTLSTIQPALLDRMEIIDLSGYVLEEKLQIASKYLLPKNRDAVGLKARDFKLPKETLTAIINDYTRESGVRQLDKTIAKLLRKKAVALADGAKAPFNIKPAELKSLLGLPIHQSGHASQEPRIGVVTGLAWTQVGGEILFIEACTSKGKGNLTMTGNLGDVMKESATLAFEYLKANADTLGVDFKTLEESNVHIHCPEGATPKDGPSAGITMFTAILSAFTHRKVRPNVAMTGEITLRGLVTPVGGIQEKILAAKRAAITDIILSEENRRDVEEINPDYLTGLQFHYISQMHEVIPLAIV